MTIKNELRRRPRGNVNPTPALPKLTEAQFTRQVIELAKLCGWKTAHFRPAQTAKGWRTAVSGDGKGFPDLILVHRTRCLVLFVELKLRPWDRTREQQEWADVLESVGMYNLWIPAYWPEIERILKGT